MNISEKNVRCAGCYTEIPIENKESLCENCQKTILNINVSWDDTPTEDISADTKDQNIFKES
jgi:Zn finger protein HypA/HybF involved in hydrogenase expression